MKQAIETHQLSKQFEPPRGWRRLARPQPITAVTDVNLAVHQGELFGLLGPNGAGKTTLVKMLCTLILPSQGSLCVAGYPLAEAAAIRAAVGLVVTDERSFYWRLTGWQNLKFFAALYGLRGGRVAERVTAVLAAVQMTEQADNRFSNYSTGMKQRLAIARALLHEPHILFLDEPSRSLDPTATQNLHELITHLRQVAAVTIFLITHDLVEAEKLCDRVAVMHQGRIQVMGSPGRLREQLQPQIDYRVQSSQLPATVVASLGQLAPDLTVSAPDSVHLKQSVVTFQAGELDGKLTAVLDHLRLHDVTIYAVQGQPPSLEEVFRHYTGQVT